MESELSGIFRVKLVTKNIVRRSSGTQFMHMRVKYPSTGKRTIPQEMIARFDSLDISPEEGICFFRHHFYSSLK